MITIMNVQGTTRSRCCLSATTRTDRLTADRDGNRSTYGTRPSKGPVSNVADCTLTIVHKIPNAFETEKTAAYHWVGLGVGIVSRTSRVHNKLT